MVKIGMLGAGFIGKVHAQAYANIPQAKVVAVCDLNADEAKKLAENFGADVSTDCSEVIGRSDVDIIDVCLPTYLHARYAVEAARAGKHVFCEKPMAFTLAEADSMIEAAEKAGISMMIGQVLRFWPEYVAIKKVLDSGELGKSLAITATRLGTAPVWSWDRWILDPNRGGGAALDLHIHDLDYVSWVWGKPNGVSARGVRSVAGAWDHIFTTLSYDDGRVALVEGTFFVPQNFPFTMALRAVCEEGTVEFTFRAGVNIEARDKVENPVVVYKRDGTIAYPEVGREDAYKAEIEYFVNCVNEGRKPEMSTPRDARQSLEIALAAIESAGRGDAGI
ncbi:MAG TPA: Gfo/Idh/MocA family oxidoreductase [Firmicutes bacterium]|nr:Gfo/Idh/MocA family oxidoreductase [Bacillota bacterium]HHY98599.1 Gfo/Idh/MocA family oxidoreductase [Bacillota bacterium]